MKLYKPHAQNPNELRTVKLFQPKLPNNMSFTQRIVFSNLVRCHAHGWTPTQREMATYLGIAQRTVCDALADLRKLHFLDESNQPILQEDFWLSRKPGKDEQNEWFNRISYITLYLPTDPKKMKLMDAAVYSAFLALAGRETSLRRLGNILGVAPRTAKKHRERLRRAKVIAVHEPPEHDQFFIPEAAPIDRMRKYFTNPQTAPAQTGQIKRAIQQAKVEARPEQPEQEFLEFKSDYEWKLEIKDKFGTDPEWEKKWNLFDAHLSEHLKPKLENPVELGDRINSIYHSILKMDGTLDEVTTQILNQAA